MVIFADTSQDMSKISEKSSTFFLKIKKSNAMMQIISNFYLAFT